MTTALRATIVVLALSSPTRAAFAWEADTTHAGLTEQAAQATRLHARLQKEHGRALGLYEHLTLPRDAAPELHAKLALLGPTGGFVPDVRGQQTGLGWLLAGAVLEDMPAGRGQNHFYDPRRKTGLRGQVGSLLARVGARLLGRRAFFVGQAAPDWIAGGKNVLGLERFWSELEGSATAPTPAERETHLALALVAAGAVVHVLEDVGSPSRAQNDFAAHLAPLGAGDEDMGSRFERLAALVYGRLGVPAANPPERRQTARAFFTSPDGRGLADVTAARWYSPGTLPGTADAVVKAKAGPARAATRDGAALRDPEGICLARVQPAGDKLRIDDECASEQIAAILPVVGAYAAGFLEWMFRGALVLSQDGDVAAGETRLGKGSIRCFAEDAKGQRGPLGTAQSVAGAASHARLAGFEAPPQGTAKVIAVFRGVDGSGEPVVAIGEVGLAK